MSENKPDVGVTEKVAEIEYETKNNLHARYIGKLNNVQQNGTTGLSYFFTNKNWMPLNVNDYDKFTKKAIKNPDKWEIKEVAVKIYEDIHKIKFKGSPYHKEKIELKVETSEIEEETGLFKTKKLILNVNTWYELSDSKIAKFLSNKSLNNPEVWSYELDKRPIVKVAK